MEPYQQRVLDEKSELDIKINALRNFFSNPIYSTMSQQDQDLLQQQLLAMETYSQVLGLRIARFL